MADQSKPLEFRALLLVDKERSAYGLRYNDFERYRKHCANRVHRLRSSLKMTHGKGRDFKKLPAVDPERITSSHLQLLLFETERAWAYAQELLELFAKSDESVDKRRAMGRTRRAQAWSSRLIEQCKTLLDTGKLKAVYYAEAATYDLLVKGRLQRTREEYETAVASLAVARNMLDELASNASTSHDQAIATVFIDEVAPEIRHCAHSLGHKRAYDIDSIVKEVSPLHRAKLIPQYDHLIEAIRDNANRVADSKTTQRVLQNLEWEGAVVPLRNPELVDAFLKVEIASAKLSASNVDRSTQQNQSKSRKKVTAFDSVLQALSDAENIARKLSEARKLSGGTIGVSDSSGGGGGGARDIHFVHSFTTYQLLSRRTQRDLLLVDALASNPPVKGSAKTAENMGAGNDPRINPAVVKIYDSILQTLNQMKALTVVDESPDIAAATEARIAYVRGARCIFMARTYASLKRYAEAVSLTQTGLLRIREARYQLSLLSSPEATPETQYFPLPEDEIFTLETIISQDETAMKREWFAYNGGSSSSSADTAQAFKKPLFYDIAFNELEDPLEKIQKRAGRVVTAVKKVAIASSVSVLPQHAATKAKIDEERAAPEPAAPEPVKASVLGGLLGGWWGRR